MELAGIRLGVEDVVGRVPSLSCVMVPSAASACVEDMHHLTNNHNHQRNETHLHQEQTRNYSRTLHPFPHHPLHLDHHHQLHLMTAWDNMIRFQRVLVPCAV